MTRVVVLILSLALAVSLAFAGSFAIVVSQNPVSSVSGPATNYGPANP